MLRAGQASVSFILQDCSGRGKKRRSLFAMPLRYLLDNALSGVDSQRQSFCEEGIGSCLNAIFPGYSVSLHLCAVENQQGSLCCVELEFEWGMNPFYCQPCAEGELVSQVCLWSVFG